MNGICKECGMELACHCNYPPKETKPSKPDPYSLQGRKWKASEDPGEYISESIYGGFYVWIETTGNEDRDGSFKWTGPIRETKAKSQADLDRFMNANGGTLE